MLTEISELLQVEMSKAIDPDMEGKVMTIYLEKGERPTVFYRVHSKDKDENVCPMTGLSAESCTDCPYWRLTIPGCRAQVDTEKGPVFIMTPAMMFVMLKYSWEERERLQSKNNKLKSSLTAQKIRNTTGKGRRKKAYDTHDSNGKKVSPPSGKSGSQMDKSNRQKNC
jgi:hypothetical protein